MTNDTNDNNYNKDADGDDNEEIHFLTADGQSILVRQYLLKYDDDVMMQCFEG